MSAVDVWIDKWSFLQEELAKAGSAQERYAVTQNIKECERKIFELGGTVPNAAGDQKTQSFSDEIVETIEQEYWFDELPLKFNKRGARTAKRLLERAYDDGKVLKQIARMAGLKVGMIDFYQPASLLPMDVLDQAAKQGKVPHLLAEVLADENSAAIHDELWDVLGEGTAKVYSIALHARPDFERRAALPSPILSRINGSDDGNFEKIVNALSCFQDSAMLSFELALREARVARIDISGKGEGTGWLVGPDLLLTAYHVIAPSIDNLGNVRARLDYKYVPKLGSKLLSKGREIKLAPSPLLAYRDHAPKPVEISEHGNDDPKLLDFALLRLNEKVGEQGVGPEGQGDERGWFNLPNGIHVFERQEGLFVLGHPKLQGDNEAGPLKLSLAMPSEAELSVHNVRVRYSVNTEGGNSGSPVMDQNLLPVALHHAGLEGTPSWDSENRWDGGFNQGIPLHLIVEEIRSQLKDSSVLNELGL